MSNFSYFLETLRNISLDWNGIIRFINIYTGSQSIVLEGKNITWPIAEQFPSCHPLDLFDYFDMDLLTPIKQISFHFNQVENIGVTILIEDKNKGSFII